MNLKWFVSRTVRTAEDMRKHVQKLLNAQRDLLSPQAVNALETALKDTRKVVADGATEDAVKKQIDNLESTANKWLKPYPNAALRENIEVLLVALAVAMAIRTFFVQPFKIPTGSMQPTLFGVTSPGYGNDPSLVIPNRIARFFDYWIHGNSYFDEVASEDGRVEYISPPMRFLLFNLKQDYQFNGHSHTVWFPPDDLFARAGYGRSVGPVSGWPIKKGEPIVRLKIVAGDHLFVDRLTYNFRPPERGEIVVFETHGIPTLPQDQFYIKRLVGLPGETIKMDEDRHLRIKSDDGPWVRLDTNTPHFENVYGFDPIKEPMPMENHYSGHVIVHPGPEASSVFDNPEHTFTIRPDHYMVMGDNTMNSLDSRYWGDFPRTNVIGKYFFVYWPLSDRFGWNVK